MLRERIKRWFGFPTVAQYHKSLLEELQKLEADEVSKSSPKPKQIKKAPVKKKAAVKKTSVKKKAASKKKAK